MTLKVRRILCMSRYDWTSMTSVPTTINYMRSQPHSIKGSWDPVLGDRCAFGRTLLPEVCSNEIYNTLGPDISGTQQHSDETNIVQLLTVL